MKSVVFTYGRFNPPHKGHRLMIEQVIETARKTKKNPIVVVSHSVGNAKNPLPVENKMRILRRWFPNVTIMSSAKNRSIAKITEDFNQNSIMIVGANRQNSFKFLPFKKVTVPRSNNAPSATMARAAATAGNKNAFKNMTGYNLTNNLRNKIVKAKNRKKK
jgi:nicotinamide mononucleotide adenylyltransferase